MFLSSRFYWSATAVILVIASGYWWAPLFTVGQVMLVILLLSCCIEALLLWSKKGITAYRQVADRLSNGDDNEVTVMVSNEYAWPVSVEVIDEAPVIFQRRDIDFTFVLKQHASRSVIYRLRPVKRGAFDFGYIRVFASVLTGMLQRRYTLGKPQKVKVYPSFLMLRRYELLAMSNHLTEMGIKRIRRAGNNTEFEQIKDYVKGDEYRSINWKASARRQRLMVNVYNQERSQQVYNIIDKGRLMQQTFGGMTYLDYAINAALVLSFVALHKDDKAGIITFGPQPDSYVPARRTPEQMENILESLYQQQTTFGESDFSALEDYVNRQVRQRSLLVVYTSFATLQTMKRQLPWLKQMARRHKVLVVFFQDAEIKAFTDMPMQTVEDYFQHMVAEQNLSDQRLIVSTLRHHGILSLLSTPQQLSIDIINKYLELKEHS